MKKLLLLFVLVFAVGANAATFNFNASGSWTDPTKWDVYPGTTVNFEDVVNLRASCTIASSVTVINNGTLNDNFELFISGGGTLTNNGGINNNNLGLFNLGTLNNNNTLNNNSARVNNTGILNNTNTFNNYSGATLINSNGGVVNNSATLSNFATLTNNSGATLNNSNTLTNNNGGTLNISGTLNNNSGATLNNNSGATLNNFKDTFNNKSGATLNNSGILRIETEFLGGGNVTLINSGTLKNFGMLTTFLGQLNNVSGGILTNSGEMKIFDMSGVSNAGTLTNTSSGTLTNGYLLDNLAAGTLINDGLLTNTDYLGNAGTLNNNGTLINNYYDNTVSNASGGKLNNNGELDNYGKLINNGTLTNNGTLLIGSFSGWLTLSGGVLNNTASNITMGNFSTIERSRGTISAAPVFQGAIYLYYTGSTAIATGPELPTSNALAYLQINNIADVTLSASATVNNQLALANGIVKTGDNILTLSAVAFVSRSGSCPLTSCFVAGNSNAGGMQKLFNAGTNANFTFPVGTTGGTDNGHTPVALSNISVDAAGNALTVRAVDAVSPAPIPHQKITRYWELTESGNITTDLTFTYLDSDDDSITDPTRLRVFRNATNMCSSDCVMENTFTGTVTGITNFSPWTIAEAAEGTTAAMVTIRGRVTAPSGRGISKALIKMTGQNGEVRYAVTNPFGYYRFIETAVGETYTFSVSAKNYTFMSRILNLVGETDELNFTAQQ